MDIIYYIPSEEKEYRLKRYKTEEVPQIGDTINIEGDYYKVINREIEYINFKDELLRNNNVTAILEKEK